MVLAAAETVMKGKTRLSPMASASKTREVWGTSHNGDAAPSAGLVKHCLITGGASRKHRFALVVRGARAHQIPKHLDESFVIERQKQEHETTGEAAPDESRRDGGYGKTDSELTLRHRPQRRQGQGQGQGHGQGNCNTQEKTQVPTAAVHQEARTSPTPIVDLRRGGPPLRRGAEPSCRRKLGDARPLAAVCHTPRRS